MKLDVQWSMSNLSNGRATDQIAICQCQFWFAASQVARVVQLAVEKVGRLGRQASRVVGRSGLTKLTGQTRPGRQAGEKKV